MKIIAIDIGGTYIKAALMNEKSEILENWKVPSDTSGMEALIHSLDECILPRLEGCDGIAISMPGKINTTKGIAHTGGAFAFIKDWEVVKELEERYHVPVSADNDGKCAANAENWVGALKDVPNGLVYVIGTGIGGGVVINNQVVHGTHFAAGELSCCINNIEAEQFFTSSFAATVIATPGLLKMYEKRTNEKVDGLAFFNKVNENDVNAVLALEEFARITAHYFYNLQVVLDVDRIAIGGGISAQPILIETIKKAYHNLYDIPYPLPCEEAEIVRCQFGNDANLIGAVKHFLDTRG